MNSVDKIIRTLDLAQSDARDETLAGIIKVIIYSNEIGFLINEIQQRIKLDFSLEVHDSEIQDCIDNLLTKGVIEKENDRIKLSIDEYLKIKRLNLLSVESQKSRFKAFSNHIVDIATEIDYAIIEPEINNLFKTFVEYLYECYLLYGKSAIINFTKYENLNEEENNSIIKRYLKSINDKCLEKIFLEYVKKFPSFVDVDLLKYLTELANKTEAFYALGLSQEEYDKIYNNISFDWIVFVDTNFLYSILNLHSHPENEAAKAVLKIGNDLGIKFKYITKTYEELNNKQKDFDKYIERNLEISQIRALLKSEKLDNFARIFYEKKLDDPSNTPHPTDIITHSQNILKQYDLTIYQSKFEALANSEDYLLDQESKYANFLSMLDELRVQHGFKMKGIKDTFQIQHDIFLREAILHLRKKNVASINEAKYFGVTLDKTLLKFDHNQLVKNSLTSIVPVFFRPTHLLKKLLKYSPVKTEDYLRAFISTISTPALDENSLTTKVAIRSVKYFHKIGINDEKLIYDCLKDEMFLTNFESKENDEEQLGEFIESEINKTIAKRTEEFEKLKEIQKDKELEISKIKDISLETNNENQKLTKRIEEVENSLVLYKNALKGFKKSSKSTSKPKDPFLVTQLTIYDEQKNLNVENKYKSIELQNEKLKEKIIKREFKTWRLTGVLVLVFGLIILFLFSLIFIWQNEDWNFVAHFFNYLETLPELRKEIIVIFVGLIITIVDIMFIRIFYNRFFNKTKIKEFKERIEY